MIDFMRWRALYFGISLCFLVPGIFFLITSGLRLAIDFTGGSVLELQFVSANSLPEISESALQSKWGEQYDIQGFQAVSATHVIVRGKPISNDEKNTLVTALTPTYGDVAVVRFETIGPVLGKELIEKTITAGIIVMVIIIAYISHQFHELKYGVSAVLAMVHDALIVIGAFSIFGKLLGVEVDVLFVTALLTILSFSVHDTIVVFDRIREIQAAHPRIPYRTIVNVAVLQTLGRSINNSMTIIIMLLALALLGGDTIHWFAVALLVGAVTGTYSSTFTAAPLLLVWDDVRQWMIKRRRAAR